MTTSQSRSDKNKAYTSIAQKQSLITSFFAKPKSVAVNSDNTNKSNAKDISDNSVTKNVTNQSIATAEIVLSTNLDSSEVIKSVVQNEEHRSPLDDNSDIYANIDSDDRINKLLTTNTTDRSIFPNTVKRRIIDDSDDFNVIINDNLSKKTVTDRYCTTDCIIENNFWDSDQSDIELDKNSLIDTTADNNIVVYDLDKFIYSNSTSTDTSKANTIESSIYSSESMSTRKSINDDLEDYNRENDEKKYYLACNASKICKMFREYIENYYLYCKTFVFPPWIQPQFIKDSSGRRPDCTSYNPSTMLIPPPTHKWINEYRNVHYTPTMKQYWSIKATHFDKLVLFKMGRFYEIFYIDACIAHKLCDLRWMGKESKPHIGFPEQSLQFYASKMVASGYKVVVVEQMETPKEMLEKKKGMKWSEKVISRDVCQILSKGTLLHSAMLPSESQPLLSIAFKSSKPMFLGDQEYCNFGLCLVDVSTNSINLSFCMDDESRLNLRTTLAHANPAEILYIPSNVNRNVVEIFKRLPLKPQLSLYEITEDDTDMEGIIEDNISSALNSINSDGTGISEADKSLILRSIILASKYLADMQLGNVIKYSNVSMPDQYATNRLKLNTCVYDHLEMFTTTLGEKKNSFFQFIDKTSTAFGSRLLRRWVSSPSTDLAVINSRLDSVEWLMENPQINNEIRTLLCSCIDVERQMGAISNNNTTKRAIQFDHVQSNRLLSFHKLLKGFEPFEVKYYQFSR